MAVVVKEHLLFKDVRDASLIPGSRRCPRGEDGNWLVFLLESHGQRGLVHLVLSQSLTQLK